MSPIGTMSVLRSVHSLEGTHLISVDFPAPKNPVIMVNGTVPNVDFELDGSTSMSSPDGGCS